MTDSSRFYQDAIDVISRMLGPDHAIEQTMSAVRKTLTRDQQIRYFVDIAQRWRDAGEPDISIEDAQDSDEVASAAPLSMFFIGLNHSQYTGNGQWTLTDEQLAEVVGNERLRAMHGLLELLRPIIASRPSSEQLVDVYNEMAQQVTAELIAAQAGDSEVAAFRAKNGNN